MGWSCDAQDASRSSQVNNLEASSHPTDPAPSTWRLQVAFTPQESCPSFSSHPSIHLSGPTWMGTHILGRKPSRTSLPDHACTSTPITCEFQARMDRELLKAWERGGGKGLRIPPLPLSQQEKSLACALMNAHMRTCNSAVPMMDASPSQLDPPSTWSQEVRDMVGKTQLHRHSTPQSQCERGPSAQIEAATGPREKAVNMKDEKHRFFN